MKDYCKVNFRYINELTLHKVDFNSQFCKIQTFFKETNQRKASMVKLLNIPKYF